MTGVQTCALPICFPVTIAIEWKRRIENEASKIEIEDIKEKRIVGRGVRYGFLIGRSYKNIGRIYNSFENIGIIDYSENVELERKLERAIEWKRRIENEASKIEIEDIKEKRIVELFPNMKNGYDMKYYNKKMEIAKRIGEITLLWNCGIKQREEGIRNKVYSIYEI